MNLSHRWYCGSRHWQRQVGRSLALVSSGLVLDGASVLELGSGPGVTTEWLLPRVGQLTSVEIDGSLVRRLARRLPQVHVIEADATDLPLPAASFDVVLSFTMLHHLPAAAAQDRLFSEARRVLRPGGVFAGIDSRWGPLFALAHIGDTMTLVEPSALAGRLHAAGFHRPQVVSARRHLQFRAEAPL